MEARNNETSNYYYIYNIEQARFFLKHGIEPCDFGKGKLNDIYILFPKNDKTKAVFNLWANKTR